MNKEILSSKEAASFLDLTMNQLYKLSSGGKLPRYSPTGGKLYFLKSELEEWVLNTPKGGNSVSTSVSNYLIKKI